MSKYGTLNTEAFTIWKSAYLRSLPHKSYPTDASVQTAFLAGQAAQWEADAKFVADLVACLKEIDRLRNLVEQLEQYATRQEMWE